MTSDMKGIGSFRRNFWLRFRKAFHMVHPKMAPRGIGAFPSLETHPMFRFHLTGIIKLDPFLGNSNKQQTYD